MDFDFLFFYLEKKIFNRPSLPKIKNKKKQMVFRILTKHNLEIKSCSGYFWLKFSYANFQINMWENSNLDQVSSVKLLVSQRHKVCLLSLLANINLKLIRRSARPAKKWQVGIQVLCLLKCTVFYQTRMNLALNRVMQTYVQRNPSYWWIKMYSRLMFK